MHSSPQISQNASVTRLMLSVIYALIPGTLVYVHFFGWGVLINMLLASITALVCEALMLKLRQRPLKPFLLDGSALLTALLLALAIPTLAPWWLPVLGAAFAIVVAKQLYGGLGYNPFNPAMVGYAMLLIAFPREMTAWLPADLHQLGFLDNLRYTFLNLLPTGQSYDALTMATPLDTVKTQTGLGVAIEQLRQGNASLFGAIAGLGWEWINLMFLLGGIALIYLRIINWRIPATMLASLAILAGIFYLYDSQLHASPLFHLFSGAAMLGAFFIATDPVTAATTPRGQLIYGAGIGILVYVIRSWGGYPDAIAFAVLLMNMAVPTIDYYTKPRVFGE